MISRPIRIKIVAFFILILAVDWYLYFRHAGHFFQGDTIFLLNQRATSLTGYLREFIELNPSGWYRPLANELIQSILYPAAGLNPVPYRIPVYALFIGITMMVYALMFAFTRRHLSAALATFFFSVHTTNAYTTYDVGFMPELLYTFFYLAAIIAYLRYLETQGKRAYWASLACFAGSLLSKEAAITLPAALLLVHMVYVAQPFRQRFTSGLRAMLPHFLLLAAYLSFVLGYLQVQSFSFVRMFDQTQTPAPGDYVPLLNPGALKNADIALTWAFNMPRASWGQALEPRLLLFHKSFRALAFALMAIVFVIGPIHRKLILFGWGFFWITLGPALPLVSHFFPYYLFLPVIGLSAAIAVAFAWSYDYLRRIQPGLAATALVLAFGGTLFVTSRSIEGDIRNNHLLGGSSSLAESTLNDLKTMYPVLPERTTVYFADARAPLAWHHDSGGLIKMAFGTGDLSILYQSKGDSIFPGIEDVLVFSVQNGRLVDETANYNAGKFLIFTNSRLTLELSAAAVSVGDKYSVRVKELQNKLARIAYTLDDGPLEVFTVSLDGEGQATLDVSGHTRRGVYRFLGVKTPEAEMWSVADQTLTVR